MAPIFANQSCDPFTPSSKPCTIGNLVRYAVNVSEPEDIVATLKFAKEHNIRFIVRNTGHDYNGRSTGAGALSVWTHNLKSVQVVDYKDSLYEGKALQIGAGIQGFDALEGAHKSNLAVITGECPSVGLAGGYVQGGGHSALSTVFGLAADNALTYDVVTPQGDIVTASPAENEDLYWALSGGGGGNYGIVYAMTVRAHQDTTVAGAKFSLAPPVNDTDKLYDMIDAFHAALPDIVDQGVMAIYFFGQDYLESPAITAYNKTSEDMAQILKPFGDALAKMGVEFQPNITQFDSYYEHYNNYWGPLPSGNIQVGTDLFGGRLIPRSVISNFSATARKMVEFNVTFIGVGLDVSSFGSDSSGAPTNAVLPQWRDSIVSASLNVPYSFTVPFKQMSDLQDHITNVIQPVLEDATPNAGCYMNEADFQQRDFQDTFFGTNYDALLKIKHKYDPDQMLYAVAGVGSEDWEELWDGRLCNVGPHSTEAGFPGGQ
jgi:hypothetical protein